MADHRRGAAGPDIASVLSPRRTRLAAWCFAVASAALLAVGVFVDLGGPDHGITLYTRDEASGTRSVFWKNALEKSDISEKALFAPSNGSMKTAVANDPYAIGYVSVGHMDESVTPAALDGVTPTLETVKSGQYTVARGLYSNTLGEPQGLAKLFIDYLFSPEGQKIVAENGFIPVK